MNISDNHLTKLRDGIYFEFVSNCKIENNLSEENLRYGLHFMFSNHNDYYDPQLKEDRLARFADHANYTHLRLDLADREGIPAAFAKYQPEGVVSLAAQAGVRYSIENPLAYIDSNVVGFANIAGLGRQSGDGGTVHDLW